MVESNWTIADSMNANKFSMQIGGDEKKHTDFSVNLSLKTAFGFQLLAVTYSVESDVLWEGSIIMAFQTHVSMCVHVTTVPGSIKKR